MVSFCGYDLVLDSYEKIASRELEIWERFYLPASPSDQTVLDLGAGCGETAAFYLSHGAKKVISVEPSPRAFSMLKRNVEKNGMNVHLINDVFKLEHLAFEHDMMKMDIEGGEMLLMDYEGRLIRPLTIETHSDKIANSLMKKFTLKRVHRMTEVGLPQLSLLHLKDSPLPEYETTLRDYLGIVKVFVRERTKGKI